MIQFIVISLAAFYVSMNIVTDVSRCSPPAPAGGPVAMAEPAASAHGHPPRRLGQDTRGRAKRPRGAVGLGLTRS